MLVSQLSRHGVPQILGDKKARLARQLEHSDLADQAAKQTGRLQLSTAYSVREQQLQMNGPTKNGCHICLTAAWQSRAPKWFQLRVLMVSDISTPVGEQRYSKADSVISHFTPNSNQYWPVMQAWISSSLVAFHPLPCYVGLVSFVVLAFPKCMPT